MERKNSDIETLIIDIERAELIASDASVDRNVREDALVQFIKRAAMPLLDLLGELKGRREEGSETSGGFKKTHRVILEGFSDKSANEAFSNALDKAAHYFAEDHDVSITVEQLIELPQGGHRATLEVHITPVTLHDAAHLKNADIELKRDHNKAFNDVRHKEEDNLHHLIFDHFTSSMGNTKTAGRLPPTLLINVNDAKLMHFMLEKQFLKAEMAWKNVEKTHPDTPNAENSRKILVRVNREIE
jgi:hypothetical protein